MSAARQCPNRRGRALKAGGMLLRSGFSARGRTAKVLCGSEWVPLGELLSQVNEACDRILARGQRTRPSPAPAH